LVTEIIQVCHLKLTQATISHKGSLAYKRLPRFYSME
jgi:hypothetical protein